MTQIEHPRCDAEGEACGTASRGGNGRSRSEKENRNGNEEELAVSAPPAGASRGRPEGEHLGRGCRPLTPIDHVTFPGIERESPFPCSFLAIVRLRVAQASGRRKKQVKSEQKRSIHVALISSCICPVNTRHKQSRTTASAHTCIHGISAYRKSLAC